MGNPDIKRMQIHLDLSDSSDALRWAREGENALEDALEELQDEGTDISSEKVPSTAEPGARGFGLDDIAIAIAANVVADVLTALLYKAVRSLFQRMHRPSGVTLRSGAEEISFDADEPALSIRERLQSWFANSALLDEPITISLD